MLNRLNVLLTRERRIFFGFWQWAILTKETVYVCEREKGGKRGDGWGSAGERSSECAANGRAIVTRDTTFAMAVVILHHVT